MNYLAFAGIYSTKELAKCNFFQKTKYIFASKSLSAEQITIQVRGVFGGAPSIIKFDRSIQSSPTGNQKVAQRYRPVFARGP